MLVHQLSLFIVHIAAADDSVHVYTDLQVPEGVYYT